MVIGIVVVILLAALLGYAATRPNTFRVQRSTDIHAAPEKIFALINDLHIWGSWSPYEKKDPGMKRTLSGAASGKGAVYEWDGNREIGKGRMEITETVPPTKVTIQIDFFKPFEAHNTVEFTLEPKGDFTNVTWAMHGPSPFFFRLVDLFVNCDEMCGKDFEAGLKSLKGVVETPVMASTGAHAGFSERPATASIWPGTREEVSMETQTREA